MNHRVWTLALIVVLAGLVGCASRDLASSRATSYDDDLPCFQAKAEWPLSSVSRTLHDTGATRLSRLPPVARDAGIATGTNSETVRQVAYFEGQPTDTDIESAELAFNDGDPVPVEELVALGLSNNPEISAARSRARALGARVPQVASLDDPTLLTRSFIESIETAAGPHDAVMRLQQKVPWFGKLALRSQAAYFEAMAAYAQVTAIELRVTEQVKRAYYDLYFVDSAIEVNNELKPRIEEVAELVRTQFALPETGVERDDVNEAEIELIRVDTTLATLGDQRTRAAARLAEALALPPSMRFVIERDIARTNVPRRAQVLVDLVDVCQPELTARRREVRRDRSRIALAEKQFYPDLTVGVSWYEIGSTGRSPVATGEDALSAGVGVNLPIYRQRLDAAVREAQSETARSASALAADGDDFRSEVQSLHAEVLEHERWLEALEVEIVPRDEEILELSIEKYRLGRLAFELLIDNYQDLLNDRIEVYRREARREQVVASLERAVGCPVSTWPLDEPEAVPPPSPMPLLSPPSAHSPR